MSFPTDPMLHWLLRTTLEASLLIGAVLLLRSALGARLTPAWRVALWIVVAVKLVVPATLPIGLGLGAVFARQQGHPRPELPVERVAAVAPPVAVVASPAETRGEGAPAPWLRLDAWLAKIWIAGACVVVGALLVRERRFRRALARCQPCDNREALALVRECAAVCGVKAPRLLAAPEGCGPAVAGLSAPVLLLPADWRARFDRAALRHVVFHELEHLRSRDLLWNWLAALLTAVHWFNPLAWLAAARFQADRELRCDARALHRLAPEERFAYGRTLLRISESFLAPPAIAGLAPCVRTHPSLQHRITMITRPSTTSPWLHTAFAGALGFLICLSFGSARAQEEPGKDRTREGQRSPEADAKKPASREGERPREGEKMRDGEAAKTGAREGDGARPRSAERDGERPKSGERDGERPKSGERDGERPKTGAREGDRPKTGERDGERPATGARDGETRRMRAGEGAADGERRRIAVRDGEGERSAGQPIEIRVLGTGDDVKVGDRTVAMSGLRGFLQGYLADKSGRPVVIDADPETPYAAVAKVLDAARDNGAKNAQIRPAAGR